MQSLRNLAVVLILLAGLAISFASAADSNAGETVVERGNIDDDY